MEQENPNGGRRTMMRTPRLWEESHRIGRLYVLATVVLIPWTFYLAISLPRHATDTRYRAAWVGFDVMLVMSIALTAYFALKIDARVQLPATATATLLVVDAWFDVMTSSGRNNTLAALILALAIELPGAAFSLYVAQRVYEHADEMAINESTGSDLDGK